MSMTSKILRWQLAQQTERNFWIESWKPKEKPMKSIIQHYWLSHLRMLQYFIDIKKGSHILEIGYGASPLISFIPDSKKFAIDPLSDVYSAYYGLGKNIMLIKGMGEDMPYRSNTFDLIFVTNTLDHVLTPNKLLSEVHRILKNDGILFLTVNCFPQVIQSIKSLRVKLGIGGITHPYIFSEKNLRGLLLEENLKILRHWHGVGDLGVYVDRHYVRTLPKRQGIVNHFRRDGIRNTIRKSLGFLDKRIHRGFRYLANESNWCLVVQK